MICTQHFSHSSGEYLCSNTHLPLFLSLNISTCSFLGLGSSIPSPLISPYLHIQFQSSLLHGASPTSISTLSHIPSPPQWTMLEHNYFYASHQACELQVRCSWQYVHWGNELKTNGSSFRGLWSSSREVELTPNHWDPFLCMEVVRIKPRFRKSKLAMLCQMKWRMAEH